MATELSPISLTPIFDNSGELVRGGSLYFYKPGTLDPVVVYKDPEQSVAWPQPITTGGSGRVPPIYVTDASDYRVRIFDAYAQLVEDIPFLPAAREDSGGGGPGEGDTAIETGDVVWSYRTGVRSGWVRLNGGTIGSSLSGATEMANDELAYDLYIHLWGQDSSFGLLEIVGGRGASAEGDWLSNKPLRLPDARGRVLAGMTTMGTGGSPILNGGLFTEGQDGDDLGATGGAATHTLTVAQLAAHPHGVTDPGHAHSASQAAHNHTLTDPGHAHGVTQSAHSHTVNDPGHTHGVTQSPHSHGVTDPGHDHSYTRPATTPNLVAPGSSTWHTGITSTSTTGDRKTGISINSANANVSINAAATGIWLSAANANVSINSAGTGITLAAAQPAVTVQNNVTGLTVNSAGGGEAHNNLAPFLLGTWYMKL